MKSMRVFITALLLSGVVITPASAENAYRYWSYWQADNGAWQYAKLGPAMTKATDGGVDGWRFGVGTVQSANAPAIRGDFDAICGNTTVASDQVRVAVVIDYGNEANSPKPRAACAVIAKGLTRASALAAVAPLRMDQGFVCGIDGYPTSGCGESVDTPEAAAAPRAASRAAAPAATAATVAESAASDSVDPTPVAASDASESSAPAGGTPTASVPTSTPDRTETSLLPTVVTMVLAVIALLVALRNAKLQQAARRP